MRRIAGALVVGACLTSLLAEAQAKPFSNGKFLNGKFLNGKFLNGKFLNGKFLNTAVVTGQGATRVSLAGWPVENVRVEGGWLTGTLGGFATLEHEQFAGVTMDGFGAEADETQLRIDAVQTHPTQADLPLYKVSYLAWVPDWDELDCGSWGCTPGAKQEWQPICDGDNLAVVIQGKWDYRMGVDGGGGRKDFEDITFACIDAAIGECVVAGYRPWETRWERIGRFWWPQEMHPMHEACVRMARADYCGDGVPATRNGTELEVIDRLAPPINVDTTPGSGILEATWDANGATCMSEVRYQELLAGLSVTDAVCVCPFREVDPAYPDDPSKWTLSCPTSDMVDEDFVPVGQIPHGNCDTMRTGTLYNEIRVAEDSAPMPSWPSPAPGDGSGAGTIVKPKWLF